MLCLWLIVHLLLLEYNFHKSRVLCFSYSSIPSTSNSASTSWKSNEYLLHQMNICCIKNQISYIHVFFLSFFPPTLSFPFHNSWQRMQPQTIHFFPNLYFTSHFNLSCAAIKSYINSLLSPLRVFLVGTYHIVTAWEGLKWCPKNTVWSLEHLKVMGQVNGKAWVKFIRKLFHILIILSEY